MITDTERLDWLAERIDSVDFNYGEDHRTIVAIRWPNVAVGCSLRENIDDAIRAIKSVTKMDTLNN